MDSISSLFDDRERLKKSAVAKGIIAMLAMLREEDLALLNLNPSILAKVRELRSADDTPGVAVSFFLLTVSAGDLTKVDQLVCGQMCAAASSSLMDQKVLTKRVFDDADVLTNTSVWGDIRDMFDSSNGVAALIGDAYYEQVDALVKYTEQYDRNIEDGRVQYVKGGEGENESPESSGNWWESLLDWVPFYGRD